MCFSNQAQIFFGHMFIPHSSFVFMEVTTKYLQQEKCQWKFEKGQCYSKG